MSKWLTKINLQLASIPGFYGDLPVAIGGFYPAFIILRDAEPDLVLLSFAADPLLFKLLGGMPGLSERIAVDVFSVIFEEDDGI